MADLPPMRFYNTLAHAVETFGAGEEPVAVYTCGPTVYDFAHIGNFRSFLFADVLRRLLELRGHGVRHVMNVTDVGHMTEDDVADGGGEDKMQLAAKRLREAKKQGKAHADAIENPDDPRQVARFYTDAFLEDARKLGLKVADEYPQNMPHATENVGEMLAMIRTPNRPRPRLRRRRRGGLLQRRELRRLRHIERQQRRAAPRRRGRAGERRAAAGQASPGRLSTVEAGRKARYAVGQRVRRGLPRLAH